ncbi:MAG: hypothetical protein Kow0037_24280 [Calditrichia bacterium]
MELNTYRLYNQGVLIVVAGRRSAEEIGKTIFRERINEGGPNYEGTRQQMILFLFENGLVLIEAQASL